MNQSLTDEQAAKLGQRVIDVLELKPLRRKLDEPRYDTAWGNKTAIGMGRTIARLVAEATEGAQS
jgi:hypothetical protein